MKIYVYGLYKENFEYKTNKLDEGLFYIGITKNLHTRMNSHRTCSSNPIKKSYINKYGFVVKILYECDSYDEALEKESFLIRWFGKIQDNTGILTNILTESNDIGLYNVGQKLSSNYRKNISRSCLDRNEQYWNNQRDERLSLPLEEIHKILQEWEDSFPIEKENICKKYNIKNNVFNWWIRKYRSDLRNLTYENRVKHIEKMNNLGLNQKEYAELIGVDQRTVSLWKCSYIRDKKPIKPRVNIKDLEYKKQKYQEWIDSGLSKREFCKNNNINYSSFKAWKNYYENY
jgi:predicted GIY-YIG superfamily endonuclease/predicted transcriptional regulator